MEKPNIIENVAEAIELCEQPHVSEALAMAALNATITTLYEAGKPDAADALRDLVAS